MTPSQLCRDQFFSHMNPWTNRSNHEETNCAWCRKQKHGAAIGKAGRTWWYCVDQGEDLGFTLSAVVWPGETSLCALLFPLPAIHCQEPGETHWKPQGQTLCGGAHWGSQ